MPALLWLLLQSKLSGDLAVGILAVLAARVTGAGGSKPVKKGWLYGFLERKAPAFTEVIEYQLQSQAFHARDFWIVVALSCVIEVIGIAHLYISMEALGDAT